MNPDPALELIRSRLFYGLARYTKSQPDLFLPNRFKPLAPSGVAAAVDRMKAALTGRDILLYVHLPFCHVECAFCNSFPVQADPDQQQNYLRHLLREIGILADTGLLERRTVRGVYFGGGTPTVFPDSDLGAILAALQSHAEFATDCTVTCEAHPTTLLAAGRVAGLAKIGVNRLSIGCQSFDPAVLRLCHRWNTAEQAQNIIAAVRAAGLRLNIDMMTGLPGQTVDSIQRDLDILDSLRPDAIEYIRHEVVNPRAEQLLRERPELIMGDDDLFAAILLTQEWLAARGYEQNGRFSGPEQWAYRYHWIQEVPILSLGSRARTYTADAFYDKCEDLGFYARMVDRGYLPIIRWMPLGRREAMYRRLLLRLQLRDGLNRAEFQADFGEDPRAAFGDLLPQLEAIGCIEQTPAAVRVTRAGGFFVEDVCDRVVDAAMREQAGDHIRHSHSEGSADWRSSDRI